MGVTIFAGGLPGWLARQEYRNRYSQGERGNGVAGSGPGAVAGDGGGEEVRDAVRARPDGSAQLVQAVPFQSQAHRPQQGAEWWGTVLRINNCLNPYLQPGFCISSERTVLV